MKETLPTFLFIFVAAFVAYASFYVIGPFNNIDSFIYVAQVEQFENGELTAEPLDVAWRAFKPLYGVVGALLGPALDPWEAMQIFNLILLFGLPFVSFGFLKELGFSREESVWGSVWIVTGYPVLKYGLAVSTDLGGWFFAVATAYLVLLGLKRNSIRTLFFASLVGFIGGTAKEPGVFGLVFGGLYILFTSGTRTLKKTLQYIAALALPAFVLEVLLFAILIYAGLPTFLDWYGLVVADDFVEEHFRLFRFIGVFGSTFSVLLPLAFFGLIHVIRRRTGTSSAFAKTGALILASLPILFWTVFISRILYIQFLAFVPLALWGVVELSHYVPETKQRAAKSMLYILPILTAVILFLIAGDRSLFEVLFV